MGRSAPRGRRVRNIEYDALPSQSQFHRLASRFKGFSGPVGSGKSQALCQEAIRLSYMNPGRLGLLGAPTFPMLRDATQAALFEILDRCKIPFEFNKAENFIVFTEVGSKVLFRSLDDYERLRGTNLAWFGIDELTYCQEEAWLRLEARLRDPRAKMLCGYAVWTPKGFDWVYRRFVAEPVDGYGVVLAKANENRHLLEQIPDFYERLKRSYDERFYQQEVLGQYLNVTAGRAYDAFDRLENVREQEYDPRQPLLWALDFNVNPMSSVIAQMDGDRIRVLDEIVLNRVTTEEACMEFVRRYPNAQRIIIYGDASGSRMQTTGSSDYSMMRRFFNQNCMNNVEYRVPKTNPAVRDRLDIMNGSLRNASGERRLLIDPRCKELIVDLEQVVLLEGTMIIDKTKDPRRTHLSDALGYLVWQEQRYRQPIGYQNRPLF
ncbi:MAG: phage terminase large subunit [Bryobacterales bacterium]|nr:phage terminase large subunit [Bryobacterales bacterium]